MTDATSPLHESMPKHIQDFIFVRELSEVYLLIDHISGRWDKSLIDSDLIKQVCEIGWPPAGTEVQQAAQATVLITAKDKLNGAARPASGATIAFTLLVAGEDNADHPAHSRIVAWFLRLLGRDPDGDGGGKGKLSPERPLAGLPDQGTPPALSGRSMTNRWNTDPPSRQSLARLAYPGLIGPARRFKWAINFIIALLLLWLMATCLLSWDIAAGHAIFVRVDALRAQQSQDEVKIKALESDIAKQKPSAALVDAHSDGLGMKLLKNCDWRRPFSPSRKIDPNLDMFTTVDEIALCNELARVQLDYAVSRRDLEGWLADWRYWLSGFAGVLCHRACLPLAQSAGAVPEVETNEQWGAILLEVLASSILPLCYGFLGAGAAIVRDLWSKMKDSLLSPRDLRLALGQLALGAVIGACIGLFVTPASSTAQGASGLLGSVVLSASALSFIAGFGVEGVFVALESLIKRVFNIPQAAKPT